jgi:hypothetical protein
MKPKQSMLSIIIFLLCTNFIANGQIHKVKILSISAVGGEYSFTQGWFNDKVNPTEFKLDEEVSTKHPNFSNATRSVEIIGEVKNDKKRARLDIFLELIANHMAKLGYQFLGMDALGPDNFLSFQKYDY